MKCLDNLDRINYPKELVCLLTKLYTFKGKDFYYEDVLKNYMSGIIKQTICRDSFYAAKILGLSVTDNRMRLIIKKNATPKTKDEKVLANLKSVFEIIQDKGVDLELTSNEFLHLATRIFAGSKEIGFTTEIVDVYENLLTIKKKISKRDALDTEIKKYKTALNSLNIEPTQVITNMYIDLLHMNCFDSYNDFISLMIEYCLLFSQRFNVFKYISFFEEYYNKMKEFSTAIVSAGFDWDKGFAQTAMLNQLTIKVLLESYEHVEGMVDDFIFDKKLKKVDNVGAVIMKMPQVFTREMIKEQCPQLSDSTINRALKRLKDVNKIRPNGTGRTATWVKLVEEEMFSTRGRQTDIFDFIGIEDD